MEYITHAVIQSGFLAGAGASSEMAYENAAEWLGTRKSDGERYDINMVENECDDFYSNLMLIRRVDDPIKFDSYLRNLGGYTFDGIGWIIDHA